MSQQDYSQFEQKMFRVVISGIVLLSIILATGWAVGSIWVDSYPGQVVKVVSPILNGTSAAREERRARNAEKWAVQEEEQQLLLTATFDERFIESTGSNFEPIDKGVVETVTEVCFFNESPLQFVAVRGEKDKYEQVLVAPGDNLQPGDPVEVIIDTERARGIRLGKPLSKKHPTLARL
ncbi:MAG: hypothetical protein A2589_03420 [Candidatus Vogelbacteria bacterium RIFOXYD1_FULL_46_19]|uniref:Uncharacterized protein n=1 Tax=Candidatus Vogelbacteria bacterium RIFOXYD1_FULL_46_19 TaxID=1802439 RepID=A0A1G2QFP0_9BACT|nr:MAG: hypothetical protein A2589_03420 [Candidatus Vogelbacteria bacterium RIFOXYD1_FULL_46_19]